MTTDLQSKFGEEYFSQNYVSYSRQNPPHKLAFYRSLAESAVRGVEHPRVLEIGCAFGRFLATLPSGWKKFGQDVSEFAIDRARDEVPGATFAVVDRPGVAFTGEFDLVVSFDVLEHIPRLDEMRSAIWSSLVPEGSLIFVVPVYDGPTGPIIRRLDRDPTHIHTRARGFWLDWVGAEFELVSWIGICRYLFPFGRYLHLTTRRFRAFTPAIAVHARKATASSADPGDSVR